MRYPNLQTWFSGHMNQSGRGHGRGGLPYQMNCVACQGVCRNAYVTFSFERQGIYRCLIDTGQILPRSTGEGNSPNIRIRI